MSKYNILYLLIRSDSKNIIDYYVKNKKNIRPIYVNKNILDNTNVITYLKNNFNIESENILFHGNHDRYRNDKYKDVFCSRNDFFVNAFYTCYEINKNIRHIMFEFERNRELENRTYIDFINKNGDKYILSHNIHEIINNNKYALIYIDNITNIFFDYIKILEHSI